MINKIASFSLSFLIFMFAIPLALAEGEDRSMTDNIDYTVVNDQWRVDSVAGNVQSKSSISDSDSWQSVGRGDLLTAPVKIKTGENGRLVLSHRKDQTTVGPNSTVEFVKEMVQEAARESTREPGILTRIVQSLGHVLFRVEKGENRTVQIESPYLVSVVKGTTFSVQVTGKRAMVNLVEGALQVDAVGIDSRVNLVTGQMAVLAEGDKDIAVFDLSSDESFDDSDATGDTLDTGAINAVTSTVKDAVLKSQSDNIIPPGLIDIPGTDNPVK